MKKYIILLEAIVQIALLRKQHLDKQKVITTLNNSSKIVHVLDTVKSL